MVMFILIGSTFSASPFAASTANSGSRDLATCRAASSASGFVNVFVFVLAFFLDYFEIAFIVIPLLVPVAAKMGIDMIWFGVLIGVNMQTSFMHPPFGFALFYLRGVAPPEVTTGDIYRGIDALRRDACSSRSCCASSSLPWRCGCRRLSAGERACRAEVQAFVSGYGRSSARRAHPPPRPSIRRRPCRPSRIAAWL